MLESQKIAYARFAHPVWVDGLGMVDSIDIRPDVETKAIKLPGVSMTWMLAERVLRVTTRAGETWLAVDCSMKPLYEDRVKAAKAAK